MWDLNAEWTFYDIPAGKIVDLEVLQCQQVAPPPPPGGTCDWVELPVEFNPHPEIEDRWNIGIDVNYPNTPPDWRYTGYITFTATTPPGCDPQFDCTEENFLPKVSLVQQPAGYEGLDCPGDCESGAFFGLANLDNGYLYSIDDVCFNKQLQGWWFNLNDDHSFIINYVMEFCSSNVICSGREILDDYSKFPSNYGCDSIFNDIKAHEKYGAPGAHYILIDIFMKHEEEHKNDFLHIIDDNKSILYYLLQRQIKGCEYFSTKEEATTFWEGEINAIYTGWHALAIGKFKDKTHNWPWSDPVKRLDYEIDTNNRIFGYIQIQKWLAELEYGCN